MPLPTPLRAAVAGGPPPVQAEAAFTLLCGGDYAGAYLLLRGLRHQAQMPPAAGYNFALCLLKAGQPAEAAAVLEAALQTSRQHRPPPGAAARPDEVFTRLALAGQQHYLAAMPPALPEVLPGRCEQNIRRLLIDAYAAQGLFEKVPPLAAGLNQFDNVAAALAGPAGTAGTAGTAPEHLAGTPE